MQKEQFMYIYKDYQIIEKRLCKFGVDEKKHLLHKFGSVPAIDKKVWDEYKDQFEEIYIRTSSGMRFKIDSLDFEKHKEEIDLGFGPQYIVKKEHWDISDRKIEKPTQEKLARKELPPVLPF